MSPCFKDGKLRISCELMYRDLICIRSYIGMTYEDWISEPHQPHQHMMFIHIINNFQFDFFRKLIYFFCFFRQSVGFSGRTLRKIPFLAHALYADMPLISLNKFLHAMKMAIEKQKQDRLEISTHTNH